MSNKTVRFGGAADKYVRPNKTFQDRLSDNQIEEKLRGYKQVADVFKENVPVNTHIRYFVKDDASKTKLFRLGGFLKKLCPEKNYIVLTNNTHSWCVNVNTADIYKKIGYEDYVELERQNNILKSYVKKHYSSKKDQSR